MFSLSSTSSTASAASPILAVGLNVEKQINRKTLSFEATKERIKRMFDKVELSVSSYDTAWVAMIPSPISPSSPFFPQCVNWLLDNQHFDGSWGLTQGQPLLMKDSLLSTLACILALKQWGVGEKQMNRACDEKQHSPIGFDIIFPSLIEQAQNLDLNISPGATNVKELRHNRELELQRGNASNSEGWRAYLAYISEGLGKSQDWQTIIKYQRKNGSLFNSPATTAAAYTHLKNTGCLGYIHSVLEKFENAVPTVYPLDIYARLCMVDSLERLGIDRHFREEIRSVLDETYRYWLQGEENIFLDSTTCAMAFRILRVNGYDVSSDPLSLYSEDKFSDSLGGYVKNVCAALEIYKASQIIIHPDESALAKQNSWTRHLLDLVNNDLMFPYHLSLERLSNRRAIEQYSVDSARVLKTSYSSLNLANKDLLKLAEEDFNLCQSLHRDEFKQLSRWVVETKLDQLKFARQKLAYSYFSTAVTLFSPESSDARISWAKNAVLATVVDDFFDVEGSEEELINLIQMVEKWNVDVSVDCCSEQVKIIFLAIRGTICEIGEKAFKWQGRDVTNHVIEIWLDLMRSMWREAEWSRTKYVATIDEYMDNAYISFALGPVVLPALYLVGPKLSDEMVESPEFHCLFKVMSTCGRLLNDICTFKRESEEGKLNVVSLRLLHGDEVITEEEVIKEFRGLINNKRRELLRLVLQEKESIIPRACKELFWKIVKVLHFFYLKDDGFTSHDMIDIVNAVIQEPIILSELLVDEENLTEVAPN
ncbi:Ent-kaurene synthase [Quillaja saponaria]|uniref:Ent-kaurene synthase n=1 Tax=Quillaja saponaria TaxID=32244 RepID=A0AAD7VNF0_QUISA|nr:Ent-kaurene synthase [Quillaja saponaria]